MGLGLGILRRTSGVREAKQSNASRENLVHHGSTESTEFFIFFGFLPCPPCFRGETSYAFARSTSSTVLMSTIPKQP
jgi:hypothetical protein